MEIQGHQDDVRPYQQLTLWEQWNVDADYFAKAHWAQYQTISFYHLPPLNEVSIWHGNHRMTTWNPTEVYRRIFSEDASKYWFNKLDIEQPSTIAFEQMGQSFKGVQIYKRLWLSKALTERLPTSTNVAKWTKDVVPDKCHRCGEQAPSARSYRKECVEKLEEYLRKVHTAPSLRKRIISFLTNDVEPRTYEEQGNITREMLTQGVILTSWMESQQRYYEWLQRRTTGKRWAIRLIAQLWGMSWNMWTHRAKIADSKESRQLQHHHVNLNHLIHSEYTTQHDHPNRHLQRRFSQPLHFCMSQNIRWKQQWLDAVVTIREATSDTS